MSDGLLINRTVLRDLIMQAREIPMTPDITARLDNAARTMRRVAVNRYYYDGAQAPSIEAELPYGLGFNLEFFDREIRRVVGMVGHMEPFVVEVVG